MKNAARTLSDSPSLSFQASAFLWLCLAGTGLAAHAQGWDKEKSQSPSVIVTPGTPHAWTMEQAHYLLERNRAHDLGLAEKSPDPLDPNDVVAFRIESIRSLLSASVSFDQAVGAKNRIALDQYNQQVATHNALTAQQQTLSIQQTVLAFQVAQAQSELDVLNAAPTTDKEKVAVKQAELTRLKTDKATLDSQQAALAAATPQLPTPPAIAGGSANDALGSTSAFGDDANFTALLNKFTSSPGSSKLSAKAILDNYVDFQYEMVAKQLTLLRDQAGPDNRVLFLELPHSIYVTQKFHPYPYIGGLWGDHLVQAWWQVDGGLMATPLCDQAVKDGVHRAPTLREFETLAHITAPSQPPAEGICESASSASSHNLITLSKFFSGGVGRKLQTPSSVESEYFTHIESTIKAMDVGRQKDVDLAIKNTRQEFATLSPNGQLNPNGELKWTPVTDRISVWRNFWSFDYALHEFGAPGSSSAPIYTLDLIPRQNSLNIAEAQSSTRQIGISGVFSWLAGIGAKARYERQQQQASQFTQTEQYATAFGKGDYKFGWTFAPKPGTKQVDAGIRTTYVVLVVPRDTRIVRLNAIGCGYRRRNVPRDPFSVEAIGVQEPANLSEDYLDHRTNELQRLHKLDEEDCGGVRTFDVEVPDSDDNFWITSATYVPVLSGNRTTLTITGRLGDQIGILINGTPLQKVPSLTQPGLTPGYVLPTNTPPTALYAVPPNAGDNGVQGVFEIIHNRSSDEDKSSDLIASFTMPAGYTGTPKVTIVSAARQALLGDLTARVPKPRPSDDSLHDMFYAQPSITRVDAIYRSDDPDHVDLTIVGHGFDVSLKSTVLVGSTPYNSSLGALNSYNMIVSGAVLMLTVPRKDLFPHASIDFITLDGNSPIDFNYPRDDDGPPKVGPLPCTGKAGKSADKKVPVAFTLTGDYFIKGAEPKPEQGVDIVSNFKSQTEWDITATLPEGKKTLDVWIVHGKNQAVKATCTIR